MAHFKTHLISNVAHNRLTAPNDFKVWHPRCVLIQCIKSG